MVSKILQEGLSKINELKPKLNSIWVKKMYAQLRLSKLNTSAQPELAMNMFYQHFGFSQCRDVGSEKGLRNMYFQEGVSCWE